MFRNVYQWASLLFVVMTSTLHGQETDFFWSLQELNSGAVNAPLTATVNPGESHTLYLYYTTNGPSDLDLVVGALLDLATSQEGVIRFTSAETLNFPVTVSDKEIGSRWVSTITCLGAAGMTGTVTDSFINEWGAFTLFEFGMVDQTAGQLFMDGGYDKSADAFLFGRIEFDVVGSPGSCVQIQIGRGNGGIVGDGGANAEFREPSFGSALISVGPLQLGDVNGDEAVDLLDVAPFVDVIQTKQYNAAADVNCDGVVDLTDVAPLVDLISGVGLSVIDPSIEGGKPQSGLLGDVNADGFINLLDIACFMDFTSNCGDPFNTDVNQDGLIDLLDACPLVQLVDSLE